MRPPSRSGFAVFTPVWRLFEPLPLACCLLVASCANPMPPTGGPPDRTPPAIADISPAPGEVNVSPDAVFIRFSEYVDLTSFNRAFSFTPEFEQQPEIRWRGRSVRISFPEPLRENTTYIVTIGTELRDVRGVALTEPITIAFSTGNEINQGRIAGQVVGAQKSEGIQGIDIYAYALPDSLPLAQLPERPDYRTQTDAEGNFELAYLNPQRYYVIALQDRNRNRLPDVAEAFAVPPDFAVLTDTLQAGTSRRWIVTQLDTIPPRPGNNRSLSSRRIELRFSEPVRLEENALTHWSLRDSLTGSPAEIRALYTRPDLPERLYLLTDSLPPERYLLSIHGVVDTSGNALITSTTSVTVEAAPDTSVLRFLGFLPQGSGVTGAVSLLPGRYPGVRFNIPVSEERFREVVDVEGLAGEPAIRIDERRGTDYYLAVDSLLHPEDSVQVSVTIPDADTVHTQVYRWYAPDELGELSGVIVAPDTTGDIVVELYPGTTTGVEDPVRMIADSTGRFVFPGLAEGQYSLRAFVDRNEDRRWNGGRVFPYEPAEPLQWGSDSLRVRSRWETAIEDTLRIPPL